jgi:hypothetical protein
LSLEPGILSLESGIFSVWSLESWV